MLTTHRRTEYVTALRSLAELCQHTAHLATDTLSIRELAAVATEICKCADDIAAEAKGELSQAVAGVEVAR